MPSGSIGEVTRSATSRPLVLQDERPTSPSTHRGVVELPHTVDAHLNPGPTTHTPNAPIAASLRKNDKLVPARTEQMDHSTPHSTPNLSSSQRLQERQARERSARNQARDEQRAAEAAADHKADLAEAEELERCIQEEAQAAQQDEDDAEEANLIAQEAKEQAELNAKSIARRDASARKRLQRKNDIANHTTGTSHHEAAIDDSVMRGPPVLDREITMDLNPGAARPEQVDHPSNPAKPKPEATSSHPPAPQFTTAS
jgi:hypothetical protein